MLSSVRMRIVFTIVGVAAVLGGAFFVLHNSDAAAWKSRMLSAEVSMGLDQMLRTEETVAPTAPLLIKITGPVAATSTEQARVPILVYHIVRPSYPTDTSAVITLAHTPEVFNAQMQYLRDAGYHVVSLGALEDYYKHGTPLPTHPIVITFDDGWRDQFVYAFPILVKHHYTATFFIFTNPIGRRGFVTWDNLRAMRDAGMTIGSHSLSHPFLTKTADPIVLWNEINKSKSIIEKNLGITVTEFAYPFGQYNPAILALVKKAGYTLARGDYLKKSDGLPILGDRLYELGALNAPTTTAQFARRFPKQ